MKVVVFGAGYFGLNYIRELGRHCVLVVDPDDEARARAKARFGVKAAWNTVPVSVAPDLGVKVAAAGIPPGFDFDAVVVTTPPDSHYAIASHFLSLGKYVLVEKPLTTDYAQALELAKYPKCMAGLVYLYHPEVERLRDAASTMQLSHIFSRRTNQGPVRPYLDALWDLAPHDISILNFVTQSTPELYNAVTEGDWAVLVLHYPHTTSVSYVSWRGGPKTRRVELVPIYGDRVIFDDLTVVLEEPPLTRMVKAFLSGTWDRCYASEGAKVVRILEEASAWSGR